MSGFVDLHVHYLPAVDDGVRTFEQGLMLCQALHRLGYAQTVTTPHIRTAMFDNRRENLEPAFAAFCERAAGEPDMPELGLSAEHFCDDVFWELFVAGQTLPYPGGHAALIEFPETTFPIGIEQRFFEMRLRGVSPVLAHPERYRPCFRNTDPLDQMLDAGLMLQLDLMSLTGRYGRRPRLAAERMLDEQVYYLACSDCHRPEDVGTVAEAIERLFDRADEDYANLLLRDHPAGLLAGDIDV